MSLDSIPSSNVPLNQSPQTPEREMVKEKLEAFIVPLITSKFPNIDKMGQVEFPQGTIDRLKSGPMEQIIQQMAQKAEGVFKKPCNEAFDSPEIFKIVSDGFLEMISIIVKEAEQLPPNLIAECHTSEAVFTHATDQKPIVATDSLGPCVGVAGYESENKFGFVIHFATEKDLEASKEMLIQKMMQMATKPITSPIALHLRGGIANCSEPLVAAIEEWAQYASEKGCPMTIVSKDVLQKEFVNPMSMSLDTRNGILSAYDYSTNPYTRKKVQATNPEEINDLFLKIFTEVAFKKPEIKVVYFAPLLS